jgi:hypothetical protein
MALCAMSFFDIFKCTWISAKKKTLAKLSTLSQLDKVVRIILNCIQFNTKVDIYINHGQKPYARVPFHDLWSIFWFYKYELHKPSFVVLVVVRRGQSSNKFLQMRPLAMKSSSNIYCKHCLWPIETFFSQCCMQKTGHG